MRTLGPRSVAAAFKRIFDVLYFLAFIPPVLLIGLLVLLSFVDSENLTPHPQVNLRFEPETYDVRPNDPQIKRFEIQDASGVLEIEGVQQGPFMISLGWAMLEALLMLFVFRQLRAIFGSLRDADPFVPENAGRIRNVGLTIIAFELSFHAYFFCSYFLFVVGRVSLDGVRMSPRFDPSFVAIFAGIALVLVAEVFRIGSRMRDEQQLTV